MLSVRRAAAKANKRVRMDSSGSDARSSGSEFQLSSESGSESEERSEEEEGSDDFNPFDEDSDSDADPWVKKRKGGDKGKPDKSHKSSHKGTAKKQKAAASPAAPPPPRDAVERACAMKEELLAAVERLGPRLPPNTLDQLIDELGGPENVAEMTGRKGRVVQNEDGSIQVRKPSTLFS